MTDNEIIKALECCCKNNNCEGCPLDYLTFSSQCASELAIKSLDLINRQQAENERLNNNISAMVVTLRNSAKAIRNESIKEFAERLKDDMVLNIDDTYIESFVEEYIDNLVKELVGEEE